MKKISLAILLLSSLLQGCAGVLVVGAASGLLVYDQRDLQTFAEDHNISYQITNKIKDEKALEHSRIAVSSFNHDVLLVGQTPHDSTRALIERIAAATPKVHKVFNEISIGAPITVKIISRDSWITTKVKSKMLTTKQLRSGSIKVITENQAVYLMGKVEPQQAKLAVEVARRIAGVEKVVKVFNYQTA